MTKSTLMHLRIPFSYFLMPVFLLGASFAGNIDWMRFWAAFIIVHLFLYPAANAFNSYYDRDIGSISCLKRPPPVDEELLTISLILDCVAVLAGLFLSWQFAVALLVYGICSKLYSHEKIRLKRRPILSWVGISIIQGGYVFLMAYFVVQNGSHFDALNEYVILAAGLVTLLMLGYYPITQVFQHADDAARGDKTISMMLGVRGTFLLAAAILFFSAGGFCWFFLVFFKSLYVLLFLLMQVLAALYFLVWSVRALKNANIADYGHVMMFNIVSASGMTLFSMIFHILERVGM